MKSIRFALLAAAAIVPFHSLSAQDAAQDTQQEDHRPGDDFHEGVIVVTAPGLERLDFLAGTSLLQGLDLQRNLDGQLGEMLTKLPGVSATSFSPGASRPVLRGLQGDRIRVLVDGLGSIDASSTSADHAVTIDPLLTDTVEVLRGPAVLLYGSSAIGGAVNVIGRRIPPAVPDEPVHIDAIMGLDTAYNQRELGASIVIPLGSNVAFHIDGTRRETDDMEIAGFAASEHLREELLEHADEEEEEGHLEEAEEMREAAAVRGRLPNSATETTSFGTGIAFFSGESNIGFSFGYYDTDYGIPGLPGIGHVHEHEHEEGEEEEHEHEDEDHEHEEHEHEHGDVTIGMKKYRLDMRGVLDLGDGFFDSLQTRWGYSDYTHTEFEGEEVGTVFDVKGVEGRVELVQSRRNGWGGSIGGQYYHEDFQADGEEAFVPPSKTNQFALFAVQEVAMGLIEFEGGARYEHTEIDVESLSASRSFGTFSGALGLSYEVDGGLRLGVNASRAERAPSAQELFADGPHIATQQYEIGDPALDKESAWGLEGYLRGDIGPATVSFGVYRNWFDQFIYLAETGGEEDGLPVFEFMQQDADHFGIEGEISMPVYEGDGLSVLAELQGDYVRATLADGSPVPRIPPRSLLGALEAQAGHFDARAEVQWFDKQDRVAALEEATDGFTHVNLSLAWHPIEGESNLVVMLQAKNVFDAEGRRHASFTKEYTPLAGRNFRLSAKVSF